MSEDDWAELVERFVDGDVTPGKMFGCDGLRTGRRFFAIRWHEQLVAKLPADRIDDLVRAGAGQHFEPMEGRRMNGWAVLPDGIEWAPVVAEARAWTASQQ